LGEGKKGLTRGRERHEKTLERKQIETKDIIGRRLKRTGYRGKNGEKKSGGLGIIHFEPERRRGGKKKNGRVKEGILSQTCLTWGGLQTKSACSKDGVEATA